MCFLGSVCEYVFLELPAENEVFIYLGIRLVHILANFLKLILIYLEQYM